MNFIDAMIAICIQNMHILDTYRNHGINKIHVVRGYKKESINFPELNYIDNDDHETTSELSSFHKAIDQISGDIVCSFGDVLFKPYLLQLLDECEDDLVIVVDTQWKDSVNRDRALSLLTESFHWVSTTITRSSSHSSSN